MLIYNFLYFKAYKNGAIFGGHGANNKAYRFVLLSHAAELTIDYSRSRSRSFWSRSHNSFCLGLGLTLFGLGLGLGFTMFWSH